MISDAHKGIHFSLICNEIDLHENHQVDSANVTITKTRPCNVLQFFTAVKNDNFQMKNFDVFFFFAQNIDCGYTVLTSTHNLCFRAKIREKNEYPCKPQFYYIKVGCKGYTLYGHVCMMHGQME